MLKDKWESFSWTPIFLGPNYHALGLLATCPSPPVSFVLASAPPSPDPYFGHYPQSHSLVFLSPLPLCNSLPAPSASPSWLSARNVGWGRPNPLLAEEGG